MKSTLELSWTSSARQCFFIYWNVVPKSNLCSQFALKMSGFLTQKQSTFPRSQLVLKSVRAPPSIITSTYVGISATQYTQESRRAAALVPPASSGQGTPQETEHAFRGAAEGWPAWRQTFRPPCHFRWSHCVGMHLWSPQVSEQVPSSHAAKTHFTRRMSWKPALLWKRSARSTE